jgi:hypothetical protein
MKDKLDVFILHSKKRRELVTDALAHSIGHCFSVFQTLEQLVGAPVIGQMLQRVSMAFAICLNVSDSAHGWAENYLCVVLKMVSKNKQSTQIYLEEVQLKSAVAHQQNNSGIGAEPSIQERETRKFMTAVFDSSTGGQ